MSRKFNVNGDCRANLHYMVNIDGRLKEIRKMIDDGDYFTINRARQYGKTTTLKALSRSLQEDYVAASLNFQKLSHADLETEPSFVEALARELLLKAAPAGNIPADILSRLQDFAQGEGKNRKLADLFACFSRWCAESEKPIVLIIDETDSAAGSLVFLDFLALLRAYYMDRDETAAFQSVILAGVYDIKNIKRNLTASGGHEIHNSPWNIAADFLVDMSFSTEDIAGMLAEYENDHKSGMDIQTAAEIIYEYTSGYPFLVSRICKLIDERIAGSREFPDIRAAWSRDGVLSAVRMLLSEQNTLFESLLNKLEDYPQLEEMLRSLLFEGKEIAYVVGMRPIETALMFGFVKKTGNIILPANRIFETLLYNLFLTAPSMQQNSMYHAGLKYRNQFISSGRLNMQLVLEKFTLHFHELYGGRQQKFLEEDGRRYFLLYLKPIINGAGNYYIESQTRNMERTDVIVDYQGEQFVIELKIWHGNAYNERGEKQLSDYLDHYHLQKGYMLSFNFNKKKQTGVRTIKIRDKILVEAVV